MSAARFLDVYRARQAVSDASIAAGRLLRIVVMLTRMVINCVREDEKRFGRGLGLGLGLGFSGRERL
jgi:hypothetical protein